MSKPWGDPSRGISSGDVLIRPERHPACRRREAQPGSCTERENLTGDAKGKGASGSNREAESTDAPERGGLLRSSDEAGVMTVERRERAIAIWLGSTGNGRNPMFNGRRQPSRWGIPASASASSRTGWRRRSGAIWRMLRNERASTGNDGIGDGCTTL